MEPVGFADAPSIDRGVLARLRRLDAQLRVTWARYSLDPYTGKVLLGSGRLDPMSGERIAGPVLDPAYYVWRKDECSSHHFFLAAYPDFGHAEVFRLEGDIARFARAQDVGPMLRARAEEARQRKIKANKQFRADKVTANKSRLHDLVFGENDAHRYGFRAPRAYGYAVQGSHTSSGEGALIRESNRADGWEG
jgi:hypothetical protein